MCLILFLSLVSSWEIVATTERVSGSAEKETELPFTFTDTSEDNFSVQILAKHWYVSVPDEYKKYIPDGASNKEMSYIKLEVPSKEMAGLVKSITSLCLFSCEEEVKITVVKIGETDVKMAIVKIDVKDKAEEEKSTILVVLNWAAVVLFYIMSALFSGIDLGLLSIDPTTIKILLASDNEKERKMGAAFRKVHRDDNWLICTLLTGNVLVNSANSILMSESTSAIGGMLISTFCISIFSEISPQAIFFRFRIKASYYTLWYTWLCMILLAPITWPLSRILNLALGNEGIHVYSQKELIGFLELKGDLDTEHGIVRGALQLSKVQVKEHFSPLSFVVHPDEKIDQELISRIIASGFSRIPVLGWDSQPRWVIPVRMLLVIPRDGSYIAGDVAPLLNERHLVLNEDMEMLLALRYFQSRGASFAFVRGAVEADNDRDATLRVIGVVTIEDIIEKMIGHEIYDETDAKLDPSEVKNVFNLLSQEEIGPTESSFKVAQGTVLTDGMRVLTGQVQVILDQEQNLFANIHAPFTVPEKLKTVVLSVTSYVTLPE
jgi:metal transporter CNNM